MQAFLGDFVFELVRAIFMCGVIVAAVIGGKKLSDYNKSKKTSTEEN